MSSLTHLRRQRKERGCHWDNTRRNKVMFRGKHSLGIVLYFCSLTQFLFLLSLFLLFRHICFFFLLRRASVFCVLDDSISLLCSLFLLHLQKSFFLQKSKAQTVSCPGSDCCRLVSYSMCSVRAGDFVSFKMLLCGGKYFHHHFSR